jgi:hypothetical protein
VHHRRVEEGGNPKVVYAIAAFLLLGALGMLAGAAWTYHDEHSGKTAQAKITKCTSGGSGKNHTVYCEGTWVDDGRVVTGPVYNGRKSYVGETKTVRVHGGRATVPTLWVSIGLAVFGAAIAAVAVWLAVVARRGPPPPPRAAEAAASQSW